MTKSLVKGRLKGKGALKLHFRILKTLGNASEASEKNLRHFFLRKELRNVINDKSYQKKKAIRQSILENYYCSYYSIVTAQN